MTIATFCFDLLRTQGPLTLEQLTDSAVAAGVTRAQNPSAAVRGALEYDAAVLPGGRWAAPLALLEGRCLTTRCTAPSYDEQVDVGAGDLGLLFQAARQPGLSWADGGQELRTRGWQPPSHLPYLESEPEEVIVITVRGGELHVSTAQVDLEMRRRSRELMGSLEVGHGRGWGYGSAGIADALRDALWTRIDADASTLREPVLPFSECYEPLAEEIRRKLAHAREQASRWVATLELPSYLQQVAQARAWELRTDVDAFLVDLLEQALDPHDRREARVLPFRR